MKRTVFIIFIVILLGIGWAFTVSDFLGEKSKENYQEQLITDADNYFKEGLYQRAINNYKEYLNNNQSEEICKKLINAYDKRLAEDDRITSDYISSMEIITATYKKNEAFVDKLADLYRKSKKYEKEYQCLSKAIKNGIDSADIKKRINEVRYINKISPLAYSDVKGPSNGEYVVTYNEYMITFSEAGKSSRSLYEYMSLANNNGDRIYTTDKDSRLISGKGVVLGIFDFKILEDAGVYSQGLVPVKNNGKYSYYDEFAKKAFGDFDYAGCFYNGKAAVKNNGVWYLINTKGEKVGDEYKDIVLSETGSYMSNDVMIASTKEGTYTIYNNKLEEKANVTCSEIGKTSNNGLIAFKNNNKWGFVNEEGKIVIEPQYDNAKSFSYGLAAVYSKGKWGFIDKNNEVVIDYKFKDTDSDAAYYFNSNGSCCVGTDDNNENEDVKLQLLSLIIGIKND